MNENAAPFTWLHAIDISSDSQESKQGFIAPTLIEKLHMKNIQEDALRQSHRGGNYFLHVKDLIVERFACYGDMFTPLPGMTDYYGPVWNTEHLESLELNNMKISDFLTPIPLEQFSSIRRLKIKGSVGQEGQVMDETTIRLAELLEVCMSATRRIGSQLCQLALPFSTLDCHQRLWKDATEAPSKGLRK
jgi:hypothetical protein